MAQLIIKLTQDQINRGKRQFTVCTQEIINDAPRNDEQVRFLYVLDKETINFLKIQQQRDLRCSLMRNLNKM